MTLGKHGTRRNKSSGKGRGKNKSHGSANSRRKSGNRDDSPEKPADMHVKGFTQCQTTRSSGMLIEQQQELHGETRTTYKFQKRKIESNWDKYEDFTVEDSEKSHAVSTVSRGADLKTLLSQPGGAASQLRLKDEAWDDSCIFDEAESEIDELFKVDFKDVADRLQAIPLYERLGIPQKYFEKDTLDKINADAAYHAERIQAIIDKEKSDRLKLHKKDKTRDNNQEQLSESQDRDKSPNERQQRNAEVQNVTKESDVFRTVDSVQYEKKSDIDQVTSSVAPCSRETLTSPTCNEDQTIVTEHKFTKVSSTTEGTCIGQGETSPDLSKTAERPVEPEAGGGEGDLEDWLDEFLNEDD